MGRGRTGTDICFMPPSPTRRGDLVDAEARAGSNGHVSWIARRPGGSTALSLNGDAGSTRPYFEKSSSVARMGRITRHYRRGDLSGHT